MVLLIGVAQRDLTTYQPPPPRSPRKNVFNKENLESFGVIHLLFPRPQNIVSLAYSLLSNLTILALLDNNK